MNRTEGQATGRHGRTLGALGGFAAGLAVWAVVAASAKNSSPTPTSGTRDPDRATHLYPVIVRHPVGAPRIPTGATNHLGEIVLVGCGACHTTTTPNSDARSSADLDQFHQGLNYLHGNLTCLSCHNSTNYDTLRLADSRPIEFKDVMTLCSQCHGPQRRDYDRGLHGGMNGYWDLTRGGRMRNGCTQCHDPHAPAFPLVLPVLPPRDRISVPKPADSAPHSH